MLIEFITAETIKRVELLFPPQEQELVCQLLIDECGNNLPFCTKSNPKQLERTRFAVLKLSNGNMNQFKQAIKLAKSDWRDALVAAKFADDINEHENWLPAQKW